MKRNVLFHLLKRNIIKAAVLAAASVFIFSCQSVQQQNALKLSERPEPAAMLPKSSDILLKIDVRNNQEIISRVLEIFEGQIPGEILEKFIERSDTVWAGLDLTSDMNRGEITDGNISSKAGTRPFVNSSIIVEGDFPKGLINWGLCWDRGWKKRGEQYRYWNEKEGVMQIAVPSDDLFFASAGCIDEMMNGLYLPSADAAPVEVLMDQDSADIIIATRNIKPEEYALFVAELKKIPLRGVILRLKRNDEQYAISGVFEMEDQVSAFLFAALFRTLIIAAKDEAGERLFPQPRDIKIQMDGSDVTLDGMIMDVESILRTENNWLEAAGY